MKLAMTAECCLRMELKLVTEETRVNGDVSVACVATVFRMFDPDEVDDAWDATRCSEGAVFLNIASILTLALFNILQLTEVA